MVVKHMEVINIQLAIDSKLMTSQFGGLYQAKNYGMSAHLDIVRSLFKKFDSAGISLKPRYDVWHTDALAYLTAALDGDSLMQISVEN